jgi:protein gp37
MECIVQKSIISWTHLTWNPTHGCSVVSEGCRHCYAADISLKYKMTTLPWTGANAAVNVTLKPHKLVEPLKIKEPSRIFVNSMSDLFHKQIPDDYIRQVFDIMNRCPQHIFQILTKRPERAAMWQYGWQPNIWMGTSVEDMRVAYRIDALRLCPAQVKFISAEPLIAPLYNLNLSGINWLIVGGESGQQFRPMPHAWGRLLRDQCHDYQTAFFFKQSSAIRTEFGTSLKHEDGTFWQWQQFPGDYRTPVMVAGHRYAYDNLLMTPGQAQALRVTNVLKSPRKTAVQSQSRNTNDLSVPQPEMLSQPPRMRQLSMFD